MLPRLLNICIWISQISIFVMCPLSSSKVHFYSKKKSSKVHLLPHVPKKVAFWSPLHSPTMHYYKDLRKTFIMTITEECHCCRKLNQLQWEVRNSSKIKKNGDKTNRNLQLKNAWRLQQEIQAFQPNSWMFHDFSHLLPTFSFSFPKIPCMFPIFFIYSCSNSLLLLFLYIVLYLTWVFFFSFWVFVVKLVSLS